MKRTVIEAGGGRYICRYYDKLMAIYCKMKKSPNGIFIRMGINKEVQSSGQQKRNELDTRVASM